MSRAKSNPSRTGPNVTTELITGEKQQTAQEDRVEGRKIHHRHIGKIVDDAVVMDVLRRADIDHGIG